MTQGTQHKQVIVLRKDLNMRKGKFGGVPTNTAVAVGPDQASKVDAITGNLPLL
jgi:peptidyl-tRNA hydrolase